MVTQRASDREGECVGPLGLVLPEVLSSLDSIARVPVDIDDGGVFSDPR